MGLMDNIRNLTNGRRNNEVIEDDYYDDYEDEPMMEEEDTHHAPARPTYTTRGAAAVAATPIADTNKFTSPSRVTNISTGSFNAGNYNMQMIVVKPERFDQVTEIADRLRDKQSVVLNLESTNKDVARRLVDFLSGCAYALDGNIQKIAISTYLITPYNVEVLGETDKDAQDIPTYY